MKLLIKDQNTNKHLPELQGKGSNMNFSFQDIESPKRYPFDGVMFSILEKEKKTS